MKNKFTIEKPMPPLWMMYPHISRFSIGWRMGYGEGYKWELSDWLDTLSDVDRLRYREMFPAPKAWRNYYNKDYDFEDMEEYEVEHIQLWNKHGEMQYSRSKLIEQYNRTGKLDAVFFWKPNDDIIDKSCLGQWQYSEFTVDIDDYYYAEQYMMAEKAHLFNDKEILLKIMESKDPKEMKALGKKVRNFNQELWDKAKYAIVLNANYFKFSQNKAMRDFLLNTGDKILVEASPLDTIWGIGLGEENEKSHNPNLWRGQNLLGFALMEVRDDLRNIYRNYDRVAWEQLSGHSE